MSYEEIKTTENNNSTTTESVPEKYFTPAVDVYDTEDAFVAVVDLPGVVKGDVKIEVDENNVLSVKAKQSFHEPDRAVVKEFIKGNYYRAFSLGDEFERDAVKAVFEDGVLEISVPRKEEQKPKRIEISI